MNGTKERLKIFKYNETQQWLSLFLYYIWKKMQLLPRGVLGSPKDIGHLRFLNSLGASIISLWSMQVLSSSEWYKTREEKRKQTEMTTKHKYQIKMKNRIIASFTKNLPHLERVKMSNRLSPNFTSNIYSLNAKFAL